MGRSRTGIGVHEKYMKIEHRHLIEDIIFIILMFLVCGLMQFICDYEIPDAEDIEIGLRNG